MGPTGSPPSSGATQTGPTQTGPGQTAENGNATVSAQGAGVTVQARASALLRNGLSFTGTASHAAGETIEIERSGHETQWRWTPTVQATVAPNGSFSATWSTDHIGQFTIRAVIVSHGLSRSATATPSMTVTVYRPARASWYGLLGHKTACGVRLTRATLGVANRTLRCGEKVALYYRGRTLVVPVVDHGPYVRGRDWDLTEATSRALGMNGVATIGAVSLPPAPSAGRG